jgi:electron transfer flavoprotein beta subunit
MTESEIYRSVVLVKQVPDTHNVTADMMTPDGTMNRGALPAVFNPEDRNALEMALQLREKHGGTVTAITMGPPKAADVLRDCLYRGADRVILLTDRKFAGADTLATSYALKCAVEKSGPFDLVFCGRQAIDGDTAQVGPQTAEKLGIPQITYAESILELKGREVTVQRALGSGTEIVRCSLPCLITVVASANTPRPPSARKRIEFKLAATPLEFPALLEKWPEFKNEEVLKKFLDSHHWIIPVWSAQDIGTEEERIGLAGSPTQVHKVNAVMLGSAESKEIAPTKEGIAAMIEELIKEYIVG